MSAEDLAREAQDPTTTPARLQELAQSDRSLWSAIAANPAAYDGLLDWLGEHGDDGVRAAIASRATATPPPPAPPAPPAPAAPPAPPAPPAPVDATAPMAAVPPAPTTSFGSVGAAAVPPAAAATTTDEEPPAGNKTAVRAAAIALAVIVLIAGGIGIAFAVSGGDDDDDERADSSSSSTQEPDSEDEPDTGLVPEDEDPDDAPGGGGGSGDFCTVMEEVNGASTNLGGDMSDPDATAQQFSDLADVYDDLEEAAPDDLKDDAAVMAEFARAVADSGLSGTPPEGFDELTTQYGEAAAAVGSAYASECL